MPTTFDALLLIAIAIAPGYIFLIFLRRMNAALTATRDPIGTVVVSFICSLLIFLIPYVALEAIELLGPLVQLPDELIPSLSLSGIFLNQAMPAITSRLLLEYFFLALIWPMIAGWLCAQAALSAPVEGMLRRFNTDQFSLTPTAWDSHVFLRNKGAHAIVTLESGEVIAGTLGQRSAVAAAKDGGDIYLQQELTMSGREVIEPLRPAACTEGVWISGKCIVSIRFIGEDADASSSR